MCGGFGLWQAQLPAVAAQDSMEGDDLGCTGFIGGADSNGTGFNRRLGNHAEGDQEMIESWMLLYIYCINI